MRKSKRKNKFLVLIALLMVVTLGYALVSTTLNINGTAGIRKNTWNVHWDPESYESTVGGSATATTPTFANDNTQMTYGVTLELPGDYYEFTIDAVNDGSIAGKIDEISHTISYTQGGQTYTTLPDYILYTIEYADQPGVAPAKGDILDPEETQKYRIRVEIDPDLTTPPPADIEITIADPIPYEQTKDRKVQPDPDYGGQASNAEAQMDLFFYEINNDGDHTASIVAINYNYDANLRRLYDVVFVGDQCHEESEEYQGEINTWTECDIEAIGTPWHDKHWDEWNEWWCGDWNGPDTPDYLARLVVPKEVPLNNEGKYAPAGEKYTITRIYSSYTSNSYYGDANVSQAKEEYIEANNGTTIYNLNWAIENLIVPDTITYFDSEIIGYRTTQYRESRNQRNLPSYWSNWSDANDPQLSVHIPSTVTSVETYSTYHGPKSDICRWGMKVKTLYIPNSVTNLGGADTLLDYQTDDPNTNNPCAFPPNIVAQDSTVAALIQASGYNGNLTIDGSKFN